MKEKSIQLKKDILIMKKFLKNKLNHKVNLLPYRLCLKNNLEIKFWLRVKLNQMMKMLLFISKKIQTKLKLTII